MSKNSPTQSNRRNWSINHFDEIGSTSSWLKENQATLADKTVAVAAFQTAGRGRLGRKWVAPANTALMFSMLLRPRWPIDQGQGSWLTMIAGVAAAEALSSSASLPIQLKWPNDVVYLTDNRLHKLGGILSEATISHNKLEQAIIGIGINVNMTLDQLPQHAATAPCSLRTITGNSFNLNQLLAVILDRFEHHYDAATQGSSPHANWQNKLVTLGQHVTATVVGQPGKPNKIEGVATGVDKWGRLLIQSKAGNIEAVAAADVTLRNG